MQFRFRHRPLQPEQQPVVEVGRIVRAHKLIPLFVHYLISQKK
jgi:hypothetical protein